jgi:hypothetical protein
MGFELVYCFKCQKRLTEDDFKEGAALRVGTHTTCIGCSEELLVQLTPAQQKAVFEQSKVTVSSKRPQESTRVEKPVRPPTFHEHLPAEPLPEPEKKKPVALIAGGAAGLLVLIVILVMAFKGGSPPPGSGTKDPATGGAGAQPGPGAGATADPQRVQEALDALRKARAFERDNAANHPAIIRQYEEAARLAEGTPHAEEALRGRDAAQARQRKIITDDAAELEKAVRDLANLSAYRKALDRIDAARKRHEAPEWGRTVDRLAKEVQDAVDGNFNRMKSRAVDCVQLGKADEAKQLREAVATWGIPKLVDELDKVLAEAAPGATPAVAIAPPVPATAEPGTIGPFEPDGGGNIRNWLVAGAFPNPNRTGLRFDFLGGEASCIPAQGRELTGSDGTKAKWSAYASPESKISFPRVSHLDRSAGRDYTLCYAACWLASDREQEVRLHVRSDDGYRLWAGDRRIGEVRDRRGLGSGEESFTVRLPAGKLRVLVKVDNVDNDHEFQLRVTAPQGGRASGLTVWN